MSDALWYWQHDGEVCGPVGWHALEQLAEQGQLLPGDLVRRAGGLVWVAAREAQSAYAAEMAAKRAAAQTYVPPAPVRTNKAARQRAQAAETARMNAASDLDLNDLLGSPDSPRQPGRRQAQAADLSRASDPLSMVLPEPGELAPPRMAPAPVRQQARPAGRAVANAGGMEMAGVMRQRSGTSYGSTALVACACVIMGFLVFAVPMGVIATLLGARALQGMYASGNPRGRGWAVTAMLAGAAEAIYFSRTVILQLAQALNIV